MRFVAYASFALGAIPLVYLGWLHLRGGKCAAALWWIALAYSVSLLADLATLAGVPWVPSIVYPLSQASLIGVVLLADRGEAIVFLMALAVAGM